LLKVGAIDVNPQALVIIDVQQGMFSFPDMQPFEGDAIVNRIVALIESARASQVPVIYIQHDGENGHPLASGSPGFAFHPALSPRPEDHVVVKRHCNAFQDTGLAHHIDGLGLRHVAVCGMQTQYCVDSFVRAAVERGVQITLVSDGHTTFGTALLAADQIIAHHNDLLNGSFATLKTTNEVAFESA
jgi:nicotinamidase-related amidase